jgi:hypothetical protein
MAAFPFPALRTSCRKDEARISMAAVRASMFGGESGI